MQSYQPTQVWKGIAQDSLVMNLDDLLCVGVVDNILLSSTIGRNKKLIPGEVIAAVINGTEQLVEEFRKHGVGIFLTGSQVSFTWEEDCTELKAILITLPILISQRWSRRKARERERERHTHTHTRRPPQAEVLTNHIVLQGVAPG